MKKAKDLVTKRFRRLRYFQVGTRVSREFRRRVKNKNERKKEICEEKSHCFCRWIWMKSRAKLRDDFVELRRQVLQQPLLQNLSNQVRYLPGEEEERDECSVCTARRLAESEKNYRLQQSFSFMI